MQDALIIFLIYDREFSDENVHSLFVEFVVFDAVVNLKI
jgi:hypothetical protein